MNRTYATGLAALLGIALFVPAPSSACLHVVEFSKDDAVAAVARADRLLSRGEARRAYQVSRRARRRLERHMRDRGRDPSTTAVVARARQITALAVVRLGGHSPISYRTARRHVLRGRAQRSLGWALGQLRERMAADPDDLGARMHFAEAAARVPEHRAEARAILTSLAERDLMPDAHGYAALLRLLRPGSEGWQSALTRCQQMAPDHAERICPSASSPAS